MRKYSLFAAAVAAGLACIAIPGAQAENYFEVESARANARAGGPTNARDRELLDKYGALSGTRGYSRSGLRRLGDGHRAHRHRHRD